VQSVHSEQDKRIISDLEQNGLLVYHVLFSLVMIGQVVDIESEYSTSFFDKVATLKSYLCVPSNIFAEAMLYDEEVDSESGRYIVIKEFIEHSDFMAKQGYSFAHTITEGSDDVDFGNIMVNMVNGDLVRVE
jgi:hypothetical protein